MAVDRAWSLARNPVDAFVLSAMRIGWTVIDGHQVVDKRGQAIDLARAPGPFVRKAVERDVEIFLWGQVVERKQQSGSDATGEAWGVLKHGA